MHNEAADRRLKRSLKVIKAYEGNCFDLQIDSRSFTPYQQGGYLTPCERPATLVFVSITNKVAEGVTFFCFFFESDR